LHDEKNLTERIPHTPFNRCLNRNEQRRSSEFAIEKKLSSGNIDEGVEQEDYKRNKRLA